MNGELSKKRECCTLVAKCAFEMWETCLALSIPTSILSQVKNEIREEEEKIATHNFAIMFWQIISFVHINCLHRKLT